MCPLFYLLMLSLFVFPLILLTSAATTGLRWNATFMPNNLTVKMDHSEISELVIYGLTEDIFDTKYINDRNYLQIRSLDEDLASVKHHEINFTEVSKDQGKWSTQFEIAGKFLGKTKVFVEIRNKQNQTEKSDEVLSVTVIRTKRLIDTLFTISVISFIAILYVSFGATIDLSCIKDILKKPVGPVICFVSQYVFMPVASYLLGYLLFPSRPELAIGLFFTGVSPGGGASNMWALLLGGNINLSITMTTISTFLAFGMMPLWIFTLGQFTFDRAQLGIPYRKIATFAIGLIIPLMIGVGIQKYFEKCAKFLMRILKPFTFALLIFIIVFAIVSNLYLFQLFSWQIIIAGLGLPWLGFVFGWFASRIFGQKVPDALAISIETGIQNTGISIYLLTFSLPQPEADLTTVVPVAVAIMTPFPLIALYLIQKFRACYQKRAEKLILNGSDSVNNYSSVST